MIPETAPAPRSERPFAGQKGPLPLPATAADACQLKAAVDAEIDNLVDKLNHARRMAAGAGIFSDPGWFTRAECKLRHLRRDQQRLQAHLKQLRKADNAQRNATLQELLIRALRDCVGEATFHDCVAEAESRLADPSTPEASHSA